MTVTRVIGPVELAERIGAVPRLPGIAHLPTPLEEAPRTAQELGLGRLWIKRDDQTGLAFGGNKARKLAFELASAKAAGADVLVAGGGVSQSNHARQSAAAAAKLGMGCVLVLRAGPKGALGQGNLLLDRLLGADVRLLETEDAGETLRTMERVADELRAQGRRPFLVRLEGPAVVAYVECALEIWRSLEERDEAADYIFLASDGGTQAGVLLGGELLQAGWTVVGVRPHPTAGDTSQQTMEGIRQGTRLLGIPSVAIPKERVINVQDYQGPGYGRPSPAGLGAIRFLARTAGILLDPVYTSKAFAALMDWARTGRLGRSPRVVFLHTGGTPALFAYEAELAPILGVP